LKVIKRNAKRPAAASEEIDAEEAEIEEAPKPFA